MSAPLVAGELEQLRAQVAALEQLLEVHERTTIEQSERLEEALRASAAREEALRRLEEQRRELIRELEAERGRLQRIFERAPAVIAIYTGPEHVITLVNPTWERVVGKREVVGRPFREVFPELADSGLFELLEQVYRTGEPYVGNEQHLRLDRRGDGVEDTYWNFLWQPLAGPDGRTRDIFVHAVEVSDQVRARQEVERKAEELARIARQLELSNRELDQFAYVTSHDLKAPLRGIANLSQWIEEDLGDVSPQIREHLELLRGRVHRMEALIEGILQYSRAGRVRQKPERVEVQRLLHEVVDLLSPPAGFEVRIDDGMPVLTTERLPLQQVCMNLIGNALKHAGGDGGRVEVGVSERGAFYEFSVADNGPGIAPEYHERIFGIFQTLEARDRVEGTGIGLSLVKKIVESRGGRVWVESQEGAGATFRFLWPKHADREQ